MIKNVSFVCLLFSVGLSGCSDNSEKIKLEEVSGQVYLINQDKGNVYRVEDNNIVLLEADTKVIMYKKEKEILEKEFNLPNDLIVDGRFKVTQGNISYILTIVEKGYQKLRDEHVDSMLSEISLEAKVPKDDNAISKAKENSNRLQTLVKSYDSNGFKVIQLIADGANDNARFDRINLEFKDEDGFSVFKELVKITGSGFTRLTGVGDDFVGLRIEGNVKNSMASPENIAEIEHTYNGFNVN